MGILADWQIVRDVGITPCALPGKREGKISYGMTSYGYDARLGYDFKMFVPTWSQVVDPKDFKAACFQDITVPEGQTLTIPPNSFVLGVTVEEVRALVHEFWNASAFDPEQQEGFMVPSRRWTIHPGDLLPMLGYVTLRHTRTERVLAALARL